MTNKETLNCINNILISDLRYDESIDYQLTSYDIEWLENAKEAVEKQIAKKPTHEATLPRVCTCPNCRNSLDEFTEFNGKRYRVIVEFCKFCGQRLFWDGDTE